jgi:hypothetical protein
MKNIRLAEVGDLYYSDKKFWFLYKIEDDHRFGYRYVLYFQSADDSNRKELITVSSLDIDGIFHKGYWWKVKLDKRDNSWYYSEGERTRRVCN